MEPSLADKFIIEGVDRECFFRKYGLTQGVGKPPKWCGINKWIWFLGHPCLHLPLAPTDRTIQYQQKQDWWTATNLVPSSWRGFYILVWRKHVETGQLEVAWSTQGLVRRCQYFIFVCFTNKLKMSFIIGWNHIMDPWKKRVIIHRGKVDLLVSSIWLVSRVPSNDSSISIQEKTTVYWEFAGWSWHVWKVG